MSITSVIASCGGQINIHKNKVVIRADATHSINGDTLYIRSKNAGGSNVNMYGCVFSGSCVVINNGVMYGSSSTRMEEIEPVEVVVNSSISNVQVTGSCDIELDGDACNDSLSVQVTGSGGFELKDKSLSNAILTISGSGNISIDNADTVGAIVTGSGSINLGTIHASINATLTGSGNIRGRASQNCKVQKLVTGSGKIRL